ncbi:MAG: hypothetical protein Q4A92_01370 [Corynebacterium sp.]|nr:hypothetical protein [Corynebacterium sp.]
MRALLKKNLQEYYRTWRIWAWVGIFAFIALTGPLTARYTSEILKFIGGEKLEALAATSSDAATHTSANQQWLHDLSQIGAIVVVVVFATALCNDLADGSFVFTLTRAISRSEFLATKLATFFAMFLTITMLSVTTNLLVTYMVFGKISLLNSMMITITWGFQLMPAIAMSLLIGVSSFSATGASISGIATFLSFNMIASIEFFQKWTPAGTANIAANYAMDREPELAWPIIASILMSLVLLTISIYHFNQREL